VYIRSERGSKVGVYGCAIGRARAFLLGPPLRCALHGGNCAGVRDVTLAGAIVAYGELGLRAPTESWNVVARDLGTGRILHRVPATATPSLQSSSTLEEVVLKSDGAIAWTVEGARADLGLVEVHALDRNGGRVLASDPLIGSLALAGSTLYWMQGGKPFSASLD
jgi:hypothetical protein